MQNCQENGVTTTVFNKTDIILSAYLKNLFFAICILASFTVPFLLWHPQWLVGGVVNALLVLSALNLKKYAILPIILLPSLAVLARGLIFGPFTIFLLYMIPAIWLGNFLLVWGIKYFHLTKNWNRWLALWISVGVKVAVLFVVAWSLVSLWVLPKLFLTTMWAFQIYTALAGWVMAIGVNYVIKKLK